MPGGAHINMHLSLPFTVIREDFAFEFDRRTKTAINDLIGQFSSLMSTCIVSNAAFKRTCCLKIQPSAT